jgi:hypothetical protein
MPFVFATARLVRVGRCLPTRGARKEKAFPAFTLLVGKHAPTRTSRVVSKKQRCSGAPPVAKHASTRTSRVVGSYH